MRSKEKTAINIIQRTLIDRKKNLIFLRRWIKNWNTCRDPYSGLDLSCYVKPNPSRETVPLKGVRIYLGDNAGLDTRELLVSPLVEQRVGHDVYDDEQLAAPATVAQSRGWSHVINVDSQLDLKALIAFFTH